MIGWSAVPWPRSRNFSRYGSARQWMRTVSPAASVSHGTLPSESSALPGPTS